MFYNLFQNKVICNFCTAAWTMIDMNLLFYSEIELPRANVEGEPPTLWWDELSDRSLLIGVFKHGEYSCHF